MYGEAASKIKQLEAQQKSLEDAKSVIKDRGVSDSDFAVQTLEAEIGNVQNEVYRLKYAQLTLPPAHIFDEHFEGGGTEAGIADMAKAYFVDGEGDADD